MITCPLGYRIVGATWEARRVVDAAAALAGYAACDPRAETQREAYLSAFQFGDDFRLLLNKTGSTAGYAGPCWSPFLWFDLDCEGDLQRAQREAARLALMLDERYKPADDDLLIFFSGAKGFHVGLPTSLWSPPPSINFAKTARRFAEHVAALASVTIDTGVYDRVRAFRAPNSRHPKTGLHKRRLSLDELTALSLERILDLSREPEPFDVPHPTGTSKTAAADWLAAAKLVAEEGEAKAARRAAGNGSPTLNRSTLDYIRAGAATGDRHRLLFSAAANLAEFGCSPALAVALLAESALDSGLPPKDVRRQINCGLAAAAPLLPPPEAPETPQNVPEGSTADAPPKAAVGLRDALARLWQAPQAAKTDQGGAVPSAILNGYMQISKRGAKTDRGEAVPSPALDAIEFPPDVPMPPLPPGAVASGKLDKPCRCGSREYAELPISEGRTRRDCRRCGRFVAFGKWYSEGGATA